MKKRYFKLQTGLRIQLNEYFGKLEEILKRPHYTIASLAVANTISYSICYTLLWYYVHVHLYLVIATKIPLYTCSDKYVATNHFANRKCTVATACNKFCRHKCYTPQKIYENFFVKSYLPCLQANCSAFCIIIFGIWWVLQ